MILHKEAKLYGLIIKMYIFLLPLTSTDIRKWIRNMLKSAKRKLLAITTISRQTKHERIEQNPIENFDVTDQLYFLEYR